MYQLLRLANVHTFAEYVSDKVGDRFVVFVDQIHVLSHIHRQVLWQVSGLIQQLEQETKVKVVHERIHVNEVLKTCTLSRK